MSEIFQSLHSDNMKTFYTWNQKYYTQGTTSIELCSRKHKKCVIFNTFKKSIKNWKTELRSC